MLRIDRVSPGIPEAPWMQQTRSNCLTNPCIQKAVWSRLSIKNITPRVCSSGNSECPHIYTTFTLLQNSVYHRLLRLPGGCRANWINSWFLRKLVSYLGGRKLGGFTNYSSRSANRAYCSLSRLQLKNQGGYVILAKYHVNCNSINPTKLYQCMLVHNTLSSVRSCHIYIGNTKSIH